MLATYDFNASHVLKFFRQYLCLTVQHKIFKAINFMHDFAIFEDSRILIPQI